MADAQDDPHHAGHRERMRQRFLRAGPEALADYEMLELVLFRAIPRRDIKKLTKDLLARFGSFAEVLAAAPGRLAEFDGLGPAAIAELKIVEAAALRLLAVKARNLPVLGSFSELIDYCRAAMARAEREEFRILFLNKRNMVIADEVQGRGTVDHTPVYPREVVRRALELGASAVILAHNHPSGDCTPSTADIRMTQEIVATAKTMGIVVHDHIIVGRDGHASFKGLRLI